MNETNDTTPTVETTPQDWKWAALLSVPPPPFDRTWRAWLGQAQMAEREAELRFWVQRRQDQAAA